MTADSISQPLDALRSLPEISISVRVGSLAQASEGLHRSGPDSSENAGGSGGRGAP